MKNILMGVLMVAVIVTGWMALTPSEENVNGGSRQKGGQANGADGKGSLRHLFAGASASFQPSGSTTATVSPPPAITTTPEAALQAARNPSDWSSQPGAVDAQGYKLLNFGSSSPLVSGDFVEAFVETARKGQKFRLVPNQAGEYQRVYIAAGEEVAVKLQFTENKPGTKIAVASLDGGRLAGSKVSELLEVGNDRSIEFVFKGSNNEGIHRVKVLSPDGEVKLLDFWVGDENVLRVNEAAS